MRTWLQAFRLRTLPLAVSSILVGSTLAYSTGSFSGSVFALTLLTAILLQVLSNLANDLGDHEHGADNAMRIGPMRSVQSGLIAPAAMKRAMLICASLAFLSGSWLIIMVFGISLTMLAFLLLGVLAIGAAVKYTFGSDPYGYAGLGDISVFVFFGPVGVVGACFLHTQEFHAFVLLPAIAFGMLSTGVLNVNNMRDISNDAASGKQTMAVRLGLDGARIYHGILTMVPLILLVLFALAFADGSWVWLFLAGSVLVAIHFYNVQRSTSPHDLDPELKRLAIGTFATALTLSIGLLLS